MRRQWACLIHNFSQLKLKPSFSNWLLQLGFLITLIVDYPGTAVDDTLIRRRFCSPAIMGVFNFFFLAFLRLSTINNFLKLFLELVCRDIDAMETTRRKVFR
jgi:hypothetical protein